MRLALFATLAVLSTLFFSAEARAGGAKKTASVIAVVNTASWCPTCTENGPRAMKALTAANKDGAMLLVTNDLTDEATSKASAARLEELGLTEAIKPVTSTGRVTFFHAKSKRALGAISVSREDQELKTAVASAKKAARSS